MTTFLAQNQFISNSTPHVPAGVGSAAADQVAPQVAAAEPLQSSCGGNFPMRGPPDSTADISQAVTSRNSGPQEALPSNERRPSEAPAPRCTEPHEGAGALGTEHIGEIFHWVRKLIKDDRRFVLNEGDFMAAIDEEPLFLREDGYLQRREA